MQESYTLEKFNSGRTVVGDAITELAKTDDRIWLLTPDIGWGCADFKAAYSGRFIDTGIAEQRSEERRVGKECRSRWSPYH